MAADCAGSTGSQVIVWGHLGDDLQLGMLEDFEYLADAARTTQQVLDCRTWKDLVNALGADGIEAEFGALVADSWADAWYQEHGEADPPVPPEGWYPDELPDLSGDWLSSRPRVNDPDHLTLPEEIMDLGEFQVHMLSGDFVSWDREALSELEELANTLGYGFVERQDLVVRVF